MKKGRERERVGGVKIYVKKAVIFTTKQILIG